MKFVAAAILALSAAPAHSFSYLDSLGGAAPAVASSVGFAPPAPAAPAASEDAPFFFTNGAADEPVDSPAFYFTSGNTDVPAATSSGSYLDALGGAASAVAPSAPAPASGAAGSSASYLSILGNGATDVSGPGITSYLDALPQNSAFGGPGISSYASSLNQYANEIIASSPSAPEVAAPAPVAPAPVAPVADAASPMATSSGSYLDALATAASQTSGAGITTYVESLPITAALAGGAGITSYASSLVSSSWAGGAGVPSYVDTLGGGIPSFTNSFSPFSGASIPASGSDVTFTIGSVTGQFDFTLEASAEMIQKLKAAGSNSVTITGRFY